MNRMKTRPAPPTVDADRPFGGVLSIWFEGATAAGRDVLDLRDQVQLMEDDSHYQLTRDRRGQYLYPFDDHAREYRGVGYTADGWVCKSLA